MPSLEILLKKSLNKRESLISVLNQEGTDCLRLFHGINEGFPGLAIDKYGDNIIIQSFRSSLDGENIEPVKEVISGFFNRDLFYIYRHRRKKGSDILYMDDIREKNDLVCSEMGLRYLVIDLKQGLDPLLFLDLRAGRRHLAEICRGKAVLNLFAYTCSAGVVAAAGGARSVTNVDFSGTWLAHGQKNAVLNHLSGEKMAFIQEDFFPVMWQYAGMGMKGRVRRRRFLKLKQRKFDVIFMDPPTTATSFFGKVDIINDYQSLFKPAVLCLNDGGEIICTNHSPRIDFDLWTEILEKCAEKAGKPVKNIQKIVPEGDFPSPDGNHPLKILIVKL